MTNDIYPVLLACPTCRKTPEPSVSVFRDMDRIRNDTWTVKCCNIECVSYNNDAVTRLWNEEVEEYVRRYRQRRPG